MSKRIIQLIVLCFFTLIIHFILMNLKKNRWKEKPAAEYGSEKVEIMFKAVYNTVNEIAEMAQVEQGRGVEEFLIGMVLKHQIRVLC